MAPCGDDATGDCTKLTVDDLKWTKVYQSVSGVETHHRFFSC